MTAVAPKSPRGSKLTQFMSDHVFGDEDRNMLAPIVDSNRMADHFRNDRRTPRPAFDHSFISFFVKFSYFQ